MGYYSYYTLELGAKDEEAGSKIEKFFLDLTQIDEYSDDFFVEAYVHENRVEKYLYFHAKWYSHDEDMYKLSKQFPEVDFYLTGDGEDSLDYWKEHWKDGCFEAQVAKIPPFTGEMKDYLVSNRKKLNDELAAMIQSYRKGD